MKKTLIVLIALAGFFKLLSAQEIDMLSSDYIKSLMDKNVRYFADVFYSSNPSDAKLISWNGGTYYAGLLEAWKYTEDPEYLKELEKVSNDFKWGIHAGHQNSTANNLLIGDVYLNLYLLNKNPAYYEALQKEIDRIADSGWKDGDSWWWVDALFMAPPTYALLARVLANKEYLDFMHEKWKITYKNFYDKRECLFYRDANWIYNPDVPSTYTSTGEKIFWSRGNGWAIGGICRLLNYLPEGHPYRKFYIKMLKKSLKTIAGLQQPDGLWTTNLIDQKDFPDTETSGSSLFCYAMAWGINNGLLNPKEYEPVIRKAWPALVKSLQSGAYLGYCQTVSHQPGNVKPADTDMFGQGLFLLAATEVLKMADQGDYFIVKESD